MEAKQFIAEFGHIANAPSGVDELRKLVLHLAVTGKLVSSIGKATAKTFIEEIENAQQERIALKEIKQNKKIEPLPSRFPFEIPNSWQWVRFGNLCHFVAGRTPPRKESIYWNTGEYPWFSIADMNHQEVITVSSETVSQEAREKSFKCSPVKAGTLIMSFKLTIGRLSVLGVDAYHNEAIISIFPFASKLNDYFLKCLSGFDLSSGNKAAIKGNTLNQDSISNILVAVPPKDQIPALLAKVDELMSICDKLEEQQKQKRRVQNQLRQASLWALTEASNPFEVKQHWLRLRDNFSSLFSSAEDTIDFSDHIKELAVKGLLCRGDSNVADLGRARSQRSELLNCYLEKKLMRKQKSISVAESDVEYPSNWQVVAFDEIALVTGGVTKGRKLKDRELISCPYLAVANVQRGFFKLTNLKTIDIPIDELEKYAVKPGDLLITEGGDWDKVGRTAIWRSNIDNCLHQNHVFKVRVPADEVLNEWVELVFNSMIGRSYFAGASKQTTNLASINMTQLRSFPFPVPPLRQQIEILNTVGALNKLCSVWKEKYERLNDLSSLFVKESIATLTGVNTVKKEEPLKVPKTELVSPITLGINKPSGKDDAPLATLLARQSGQMNANDLWQRFGGEIDAFYAQLKVEVVHGWIAEPEAANMLENDEE